MIKLKNLHYGMRRLRLTPASGLLLATILFILLLVLASAAQAKSTPLTRAMATTGRKFCKPLPRSVARRSCFALQNEVATGSWIFGWQISQANEATIADWRMVPLRIRQNYTQEMLALARVYLKGHAWSYGEPPTIGGKVRYYDDNAWVGKSFVDAFNMSHLPAARIAANGIMRFEVSGWATRKGGMYWNTKRNARVSDATAGVIGLALKLDQMNRSRQWLPFARKAYSWMYTTLGQPNDLYHQRLHDGLPVGVASINVEGMIIQDGRMLHGATSVQSYQDQTNETQAAINSRYTLTVLKGICPVYTGQYFYGVGQTPVLSPYANWLVSRTDAGSIRILSTWSKARGTNAQAGTAWVLIKRILAKRFHRAG